MENIKEIIYVAMQTKLVQHLSVNVGDNLNRFIRIYSDSICPWSLCQSIEHEVHNILYTNCMSEIEENFFKWRI